MNVLILGGAGFLGSFLTEKLLSHDCLVTIFDRLSPETLSHEMVEIIEHPNVRYEQLDLLNEPFKQKIDHQHTHVVHLAAQLGVQNVLDNPQQVLWDNVALTNIAIDIAIKQKNLKQLLFASTSEIYAGSVASGVAPIPTNETTSLVLPELSNPRTSYMLSKIYGEAMVQHSGLPSINFRPHNLYGPRMGFRHVIPQLYEKALKSRDGSLTVFSPDHTRCFCFIDDATELLWRLMRIHVASATTVNIGRQNEEINMRGLAEKIIEMAGLDLFIVEAEETLGSPKRRAPDMNLCEALTGYKSAISLEDGLQRTINWYQKILRQN